MNYTLDKTFVNVPSWWGGSTTVLADVKINIEPEKESEKKGSYTFFGQCPSPQTVDFFRADYFSKENVLLSKRVRELTERCSQLEEKLGAQVDQRNERVELQNKLRFKDEKIMALGRRMDQLETELRGTKLELGAAKFTVDVLAELLNEVAKRDIQTGLQDFMATGLKAFGFSGNSPDCTAHFLGHPIEYWMQLHLAHQEQGKQESAVDDK